MTLEHRVVYDEGILFTSTPAPKHGGTYYYCTEPVERQQPKFDKLGRKTRYTELVVEECGKRFRSAKTYRRHWRRSHRELCHARTRGVYTGNAIR